MLPSYDFVSTISIIIWLSLASFLILFSSAFFEACTCRDIEFGFFSSFFYIKPPYSRLGLNETSIVVWENSRVSEYQVYMSTWCVWQSVTWLTSVFLNDVTIYFLIHLKDKYCEVLDICTMLFHLALHLLTLTVFETAVPTLKWREVLQ